MVAQEIESIRDDIAIIRSKIRKLYLDAKIPKDRVQCVEGLLTCGLATLSLVVREFENK